MVKKTLTMWPGLPFLWPRVGTYSTITQSMLRGEVCSEFNFIYSFISHPSSLIRPRTALCMNESCSLRQMTLRTLSVVLEGLNVTLLVMIFLALPGSWYSTASGRRSVASE